MYKTYDDYSYHFCYLPELVSALSGLLDVVIALEPVAVAVACVAVAAAAKAARFCIGLRPNTHTYTNIYNFKTVDTPSSDQV